MNHHRALFFPGQHVEPYSPDVLAGRRPLYLVRPFGVGYRAHFYNCSSCGLRVAVNVQHPEAARLLEARVCPNHAPWFAVVGQAAKKCSVCWRPVPAAGADRCGTCREAVDRVQAWWNGDGVQGGQGRSAASVRSSGLVVAIVFVVLGLALAASWGLHQFFAS